MAQTKIRLLLVSSCFSAVACQWRRNFKLSNYEPLSPLVFLTLLLRRRDSHHYFSSYSHSYHAHCSHYLLPRIPFRLHWEAGGILFLFRTAKLFISSDNQYIFSFREDKYLLVERYWMFFFLKSYVVYSVATKCYFLYIFFSLVPFVLSLLFFRFSISQVTMLSPQLLLVCNTTQTLFKERHLLPSCMF